MSKVIIVGAGGVGGVVAHKCAQLSETFTEIVLASRTIAKCNKIAADVKELQGREIRTEAIDADDVAATTAFLEKEKPDLLINVALPYQDLVLMDACLAAGVDYLDTANYEPPETPKFEYKWQWAYRERYEQAKRMALLGSGFDPGVTNVFCAYAQKHLFDEIHTIDILDANAGDHGYPFATNFNPEINIREITQNGRYWEKGEWKEVEPMSVKQVYDFPVVGPQDAYLLYHEEMESLCENIKGLQRIRFWMTFSEKYLTHLRVLENVGMTNHETIDFQGQQIAPLEFLRAVLPDPASLGPRTKGKTCIGCDIVGVKDGEPKRVFIYNSCDHQECYKEVRSQAISYTTGVPAMIGASLILDGLWRKDGVWNMEQLDPDPFMERLNQYGLPWEVIEMPVDAEASDVFY
ncbi:saccharopine dehydrogenase family protein [Rubellicoccus peritrichatus]|uniref:Saccharopine dehydrogenase family protein n=1 Tax=Rubellicoccus peritrichatus TaxID=3080537 RepID=A0AAQ3LBC4_9BACT|nr:saccharopine dehydrogenase family protein [Puniceicoccus sp. CR14]WOO41182.1 saccharopine dehydrogenase family protein [Puniceicoccus sp. CR14]